MTVSRPARPPLPPVLRVDDVVVAALVCDPDVQSRAEMRADKVQDYVELLLNGQDFEDDLEVYEDAATGRLWVADGFHRIAAARRAGRVKLRANVRSGGKRAATLHSAGANASHGIQRSPADKRRAVGMLLGDPEWGAWSDKVISEACGVTRQFVSKMRGEMTRNGCEWPAERRGADGRVINTANIGQRPPLPQPAPPRAHPTYPPDDGDCDDDDGSTDGDGRIDEIEDDGTLGTAPPPKVRVSAITASLLGRAERAKSKGSVLHAAKIDPLDRGAAAAAVREGWLSSVGRDYTITEAGVVALAAFLEEYPGADLGLDTDADTDGDGAVNFLPRFYTGGTVEEEGAPVDLRPATPIPALPPDDLPPVVDLGTPSEIPMPPAPRRPVADTRAERRTEHAAAARAVVGYERPEIRLGDARTLIPQIRGASLIHTDPPWIYDNSQNGAADGHYTLLTCAEIAGHLNAAWDSALDDAVLLCWVTSPQLALWMSVTGIAEIQGGWRWSYKTALAWHKTPGIGPGYWARSDHEHLLIYTKGQPVPPAPPPRSLWAGPRGKHSEKPSTWLAELLAVYSPPGSLVLDVYAGLGSCGEAAVAAGLRYVGIEVDEHRRDRGQARIDLLVGGALVGEDA